MTVAKRVRLGSLCSTLWLACLFGQGSLFADTSRGHLEPDDAVERSLAAGESHYYRHSSDSDGDAWRLSVDQLGIDVEVVLVLEDGERIAIDSPLDRAGSEFLVVQAEDFGVEIHARELAAPSGRYRLLLQSYPRSVAGAEQLIEAERLQMAAARSYAADQRGDALNHYLAAFDAWRLLGRPEEEARAMYCAAVLFRLVGDTKKALDLAQQVLVRWQELGQRHWQAATQNEIGLNQWTLGNGDSAREHYRQALDSWRHLGNLRGQATVRNSLCVTRLTEGDLRQGLACYGEVFESFDEQREPRLAATMHTNAGWASNSLGNPDQALAHYSRALDLAQRVADRKGEAQALNNLGWLLHSSGQSEGALARYERALGIFQQLEDARWQAIVLHNTGITYAVLGEPERALSYLRRALELRQQVGHRRGEVATLNHLGWVLTHLGERQQALKRHQQALAVVRTLDDSRLQAIALQMSAETLATGDPHSALHQAEEAVKLLREAEDRFNLAAALDLIGRLRTALDEPEQARTALDEALALRRSIKDLPGEVATLTASAQVARMLGQIESAKAVVESALEGIDELRSRVASTDLRATFQSTHRQAHELHVDLFMALHDSSPDRGYDRQALVASERARARVFLDLLNPEQGFGPGLDPELQARRATLERRLSAKAVRRSELLARGDQPAEAALVDQEFDTTLRQLERLEAEIRSANPRYADLLQPTILDSSEIQHLLDPETVLLEYSLGDQRSFLWWVTSDEIVAFELPARAEIEELTRRLHRYVRSRSPRDRQLQQQTAAELQRILLAPVAERLNNQRLVVVADGALHLLPFAALPGVDGSKPLVESHELVFLPSATVLATQRQLLASRRPAPHGLAVVADPVFSLDDPRLARAPKTPAIAAAPTDLARSELELETPGFQRLLGSAREGQAIAALAPEGDVLMALGFEANRSLVVGDSLRPYQILHFATHGILDSRTPRLSGLVLSRFDRQGHPQEGFLRVQDLFDLRFDSELVVLSGCQTALGREIRGEGLVGLSRGFMHAGVARVVASLWQVDDRATAQLMTRFYRSLMVDGSSPAAALRAAQLSLRQERKWQDPYFWAGFVLVGEWAAFESFAVE